MHRISNNVSFVLAGKETIVVQKLRAFLFGCNHNPI